MLGTRLLAAAVGLAIILPAVLFGGGWEVFWIAVPFVVLGLDEYVRMVNPSVRTPEWLLLLLVGFVLYAVAGRWPSALPVALPVAFVVVLLLPVFGQDDAGRGAELATRYGFGLVYVPVAMAPLGRIRAEEDGLALMFLLFASTWLGDTGAYFVGRSFGRTPFFPRISPSKTVEGFLGGVALAVVGGAVVHVVGRPDLPIFATLFLAFILDLAGVAGDLAESMLKRAFGVKDSGWIMPGHGGILDRIDSLLFTAPVLWAVVELRSMFMG